MKRTILKIFWLFVFSILITSPAQVYAYLGSHKGILECSNCHTNFPYSISSAEGNVNLCLSCHTGGATASNFALYSVDQASITDSGVYGKSHRWDAVALQVNISSNPLITTAETGVKKRDGSTTIIYHVSFNIAKAFKDAKGDYRIACSSCHNSKTTSFIRNEKERDAKLCAECHTYDFQMSTTTVLSYSGKKCNHPVKSVGSSYVGCSSCHVIHAK